VGEWHEYVIRVSVMVRGVRVRVGVRVRRVRAKGIDTVPVHAPRCEGNLFAMPGRVAAILGSDL